MDSFTLAGGRLILEDGVLPRMSVEVKDGKIRNIYPLGAKQPVGTVIDAENLYISPGLIDLHVHGGGGGDFMDATAEAFRAALKLHLAHGTTTLFPTTLTAQLSELKEVITAFQAVRNGEDSKKLPYMPGLHMEGPYIAPAMMGAQDLRYIKEPDEAEYMQIVNALGDATLIWTVAPEIPGVIDMCAKLSGRGIRFSIGHSEAQYKEVLAAVQVGCTMSTHLYSSMSTIIREDGYRKLGVIESTLLLDALKAEVIADGEHLPPELLRLIYKTKGEDGILLVTDSMRGAGMAPGEYMLGSIKNGQKVKVAPDIARMPDGISFAGSVATADRLIRVMHQKAGVPIHKAVKMMSANPAKAVGLYESKGSVAVGKDADIILFDENITVKRVFIRGLDVYKN